MGSENGDESNSPELMRARNMEVIKGIPEAMNLLLPAQNEITLVHITGTDSAKNIAEKGFALEHTLYGAQDLIYTTNRLYRPGYEVSASWPQEDIREHNLQTLSAVHRGFDSVVVLRLPDNQPQIEIPPERKDTSVLGDFQRRHGLFAHAQWDALNRLYFNEDEERFHIPPAQVYGVIDRKNGLFVPNPQFKSSDTSSKEPKSMLRRFKIKIKRN